jgi:hypothetical protein
MQVVLHDDAPHPYAPHAVGTSRHLPFPSHFERCVSTPAAQAVLLHATVVAARLQRVMSTPLHDGPQVVPRPAPKQAARPAVGAPTTAEQVPSFPTRLHAPHCSCAPAPSAQAVLQHTPSTQNVLVHSRPAVQDSPFALFATQVVPEHQ